MGSIVKNMSTTNVYALYEAKVKAKQKEAKDEAVALHPFMMVPTRSSVTFAFPKADKEGKAAASGESACCPECKIVMHVAAATELNYDGGPNTVEVLSMGPEGKCSPPETVYDTLVFSDQGSFFCFGDCPEDHYQLDMVQHASTGDPISAWGLSFDLMWFQNADGATAGAAKVLRSLENVAADLLEGDDRFDKDTILANTRNALRQRVDAWVPGCEQIHAAWEKKHVVKTQGKPKVETRVAERKRLGPNVETRACAAAQRRRVMQPK